MKQIIAILFVLIFLPGWACTQNIQWEALNGDQMGMDKPCDIGVLEHTVCFPVVYRMEEGKWKKVTPGEITSSPGVLGQGGVSVGYYGSNIGDGDVSQSQNQSQMQNQGGMMPRGRD